MIRLSGFSGPPRSSGLVGARIRPVLPPFIPLDDFMGEFIFTAEPPFENRRAQAGHVGGYATRGGGDLSRGSRCVKNVVSREVRIIGVRVISS